jgi:hypothetical protein
MSKIQGSVFTGADINLESRLTSYFNENEFQTKSSERKWGL